MLFHCKYCKHWFWESADKGAAIHRNKEAFRWSDFFISISIKIKTSITPTIVPGAQNRKGTESGLLAPRYSLSWWRGPTTHAEGAVIYDHSHHCHLHQNHHHHHHCQLDLKKSSVSRKCCKGTKLQILQVCKEKFASSAILLKTCKVCHFCKIY